MKNVLLVCLQGLTSGVLARKMTALAAEKKEPYTFRASGISDVSRQYEWADYVIMTPQVRDRIGDLSKAGEENGFQCFILTSIMIQFQDAERTYHNITSTISPVKEAHKGRFTAEKFLQVFAGVSIIGAFAYLVYLISGITLFMNLFDHTFGIISFYCMLALGYGLYTESGGDGLHGILTAVMIMLCLTPARLAGSQQINNIVQTSVEMQTEWWSIKYLLYYTIIELVFLFLSEFLSKKFFNLHLQAGMVISDRNHFLFRLFPMTVLMILIIAVRVVISCYM